MKILISGGTGYLAGRIAQYLNDIGGYDIVLITRMKIYEKKNNSNFPIVQINWGSDKNLQQICNGVDIIIHLAGTNAKDSMSDPIMALEFNAIITGKFLNIAVKSGVQKFIYFSTAHVYKSPLMGIITEDTLPTSLHPYATSHKAGEDIVLGAHSRKEIEGIVFRLSNAFGLPVNKESNCWNLVVNDLCKQIITTGEMKLTSSGMQRRDFISINDVCNAINHIIKLPKSNESRNIFNLGGEWSPTIWELANEIKNISKEVIGNEPRLTRIKPLYDEQTEILEFKINKLKKTGFSLLNNKEEEIIKLLEFCKQNFK